MSCLVLLLFLHGAALAQDPAPADETTATPAGFTLTALFQGDPSEPPAREQALLGDAAEGEAGWLLGLQPNGAWSFRLSDGAAQLSYAPTAARQGVLDGRPHLVQISADPARAEARFFFDGRQVAIYELGGFEAALERQPRSWSHPALREHRLVAGPTGVAALRRQAQELGFAPELPRLAPGDRFRVMAWNIWHGGREDGEELGPQRVVECIQAARADLVCMQETYGSGAILADALGYELYLRSSNLSILSRYPIGETHRLYQPFRFGGARIRLGPERELDLFTLWIHYLPDYWDQMKQEQPPEAAAMVEAEWQTRGAEITDILAALQPLIADDDGVPLIVGGDFNSGSHLDWTPAARSAHRGLVVEFPVSKAMEQAGFSDSYRLIHPDPLEHPGHTWSPRFTEAWQDRIDYLYFQGALELLDAEHRDQHPARWPSDHGAMVAEFRLPAAASAAESADG